MALSSKHQLVCMHQEKNNPSLVSPMKAGLRRRVHRVSFLGLAL